MSEWKFVRAGVDGDENKFENKWAEINSGTRGSESKSKFENVS